MTLLIIAGVVAAAVVAVQLLRGALWRAADRAISAQFPLGDGGIIRGGQSILCSGYPRAALLLHGFGDTPRSLEPLAQRLANAGWSVSVPLLPGHARNLAQFHASRAADWTRAVHAAYDELSLRYETVVVCGQSMGAALALALESRRPVPALVLLAPYIAMPAIARIAAAFWPLFQWVIPVIYTRDRRSIRDPEAGAKSLAYGYTTPRLLSELWKVVRRARRDLEQVRSPTLVVHSREDNRVRPQEVAAAVARIEHPVKAMNWVSGCGHVLAADYCKDQVAALVIDWFERCTAPLRATTTAR